MKPTLDVLIGWLAVVVSLPAAPPERGATRLLPSQTSGPESAASAPAHLQQGPMLGHVGPGNAIIWAQASSAARLSVRVSPQETLAAARPFDGPLLAAASAFMGTVTVSGLAPAQRYYYCLWLDGRPAMLPPYPSFITAPPTGEPAHVRFAFISCVGHHGYDAAPGYADLAARTNFDLLLMLGDNHYANTADPVKQRAYYADQRRQGGWRELAARTPVYAIWDDHDFGPDNSDGTLKGKEQSLQTFREVWANPAYGEPDHPGVYFKFIRGNVEFFMLDGRYHRSPNKTRDGPDKTLLGARQLEWFKRALVASTAPVKVVAIGVEWQSFGTGDSWTAFQHERDAIYRFLEGQHIEGILFITGDRHFTGAYQVKGRWLEVTSGPLGSSNAKTKDLPEMFLNFSEPKGKYYCVYDVDTRPATPKVTLEVYRVGDGLVERRLFTWDEVLGRTQIPPLSAAAQVKP